MVFKGTYNGTEMAAKQVLGGEGNTDRDAFEREVSTLIVGSLQWPLWPWYCGRGYAPPAKSSKLPSQSLSFVFH